jgi:hypothetical protein
MEGFGNLTRSVAVENELARMDFLEQEIEQMTEYTLAKELIDGLR